MVSGLYAIKQDKDTSTGDTYRPSPQEVDQEIATEASGEHLRNDVQVRNQSRLQDDRNVGGVEQLDGICVVLATVTCRLDGQVNSKALWKTKFKPIFNLSSAITS